MEFITLDNLRHYHSLIKELLAENPNVGSKAISEMQIDALFVEPNEIIIYYEGEEPIINTHLIEGLHVEEKI